MTTDSRGFRDLRDSVRPDAGARVAVLGASYAFGVGVGATEDLLHVKLESALRERADWPQDTEVHNLSQTGFFLGEIVTLARRQLAHHGPHLVVLMLPSRTWLGSSRRPEADIVDGYRLPPGRAWPGSPLDTLRTRSFLWMRTTDPTGGGVAFHRAKLAQWAGVEAPPRGPSTPDRMSLLDLRSMCDRMHARLVCVTFDAGGPTAPMDAWLASVDIPFVSLRPERDWALVHDSHRGPRGHEQAALQIARALPPRAELTVEGR